MVGRYSGRYTQTLTKWGTDEHVYPSSSGDPLPTIKPDQTDHNQTVLDNALRLKYPMLYACREQRCCQCKCLLIEGMVDNPYPHPELRLGEFLACGTYIHLSLIHI